MLTSAPVIDNVVDMKKQPEKFTQQDFGQILGLPQSRVSRLLNGKDTVTASLAITLSTLFPGRTAKEWLLATPEDLRRLYRQAKIEAAVRTSDPAKAS